MKIVNQQIELWTEISEGGVKELRHLERCARVSYKSKGKVSNDIEATKHFLRERIERGELSVIEHGSITVLITTDRGISHELVRHRLCSFTQESTRYCNYSNDRFENQITVVKPYQFLPGDQEYDIWKQSCEHAERAYFGLLNKGVAPQTARSVLPNSLKTEVVMTANYREWRHVFALRTAITAHPQMRVLMRALHDNLKQKIPVIFDLEENDYE